MEKTLHILLIDDDPDDGYLFKEALAALNENILFNYKSSGSDALQWLSTTNDLPHYIFLDLNMPRMNGMEVLREIKKASCCSHIPVIIYSTSNNELHKEESKRDGASLYITKPFKLADLKNSIRRVFDTL